MSALSDITRGIRAAKADKQITVEEWQSEIEPAADSTPLAASEVAEKVLSLWADDHYSIDPQVRQWMQAFLDSRGYDVPDARPSGVATSTLVRQLEDENVGETDRTFDAIAAKAGQTKNTVTIADIDNGFDLWHPELGHKGWTNPREIPGNGVDEDGDGRVDDSNGWDWVDWNNDVSNPNGDWHGTHTAVIATAGTDRVAFIPCRVLGGDQPYDPRALENACEYAIGNGAKVINMSFGIDTPERVSIMKGVLARHPDVLFVVADGNDNRSLSSYDPNSFLAANDLPNLAVVSASDAQGNKAGFSNFGGSATLAARGTDVLSTIPGAKYAKISGTSMASPAVVNCASKCLLLDPGLDPVKLKGLLADTSDKSANWAGLDEAGGVIDPQRAFQLAALTGLARRGSSLSAAADQLGLRGALRTELLALAPKYV
jgi:subtilisin family serine protease